MYNCIIKWSGDNFPKLANNPMVRLQDNSMSVNCTEYTHKQDFGGCVTSKLIRTWVKLSKMKVKTFYNAQYQHLSAAIFYIKNGVTPWSHT